MIVRSVLLIPYYSTVGNLVLCPRLNSSNIGENKSSKKSTKPIISKPMPLEPVTTTVASASQGQPVTTK